MRLTRTDSGRSSHATSGSRAARLWALPVVIAACLLIFALDRATGTAPVQHLYYLPIVLAACYFGKSGGLITAVSVICLYHLANTSLLSRRYQESDLIQIVLFAAVGIVTAKVADDSRKLRRLAMTDDLTGLRNLRSFEAGLLNMVRTARQTNTPLSVFVLDVDRLKDINDRHGHLAGAEAVRMIGQIIAQQLPGDGIACRYGGDEFAMAVAHCDAARAEQIATGLCRTVNGTAPRLVGQHWPAGTLSISVGVMCRTRGAPDPPPALLTEEEEGEALFHAGDQALYQAKIEGRNRVCVQASPQSAGSSGKITNLVRGKANLWPS